ncbi:Uncharacterized protein FKW44_012603, partial [Caligus rogercresseyi]
DDVCDEDLNVGHGNCYSKSPGARFYYNYNTGNWNENRFPSEDACLKACAYSHQEDDDEEE